MRAEKRKNHRIRHPNLYFFYQDRELQPAKGGKKGAGMKKKEFAERCGFGMGFAGCRQIREKEGGNRDKGRGQLTRQNSREKKCLFYVKKRALLGYKKKR